MHGSTRCRQTNIYERTGITTSGLLRAPSMNVFVGLSSTGSLVRRLSPSRMSGLLADRFLLSQWKKYLTIVRWQWRQVMLFFFVSSIALFRLQPLCLGHRRRSCVEGMGVSSGLSLIGMEPHGVPVWQECRIPSTDTAAIVNTSFMGASPFPPLPRLPPPPSPAAPVFLSSVDCLLYPLDLTGTSAFFPVFCCRSCGGWCMNIISSNPASTTPFALYCWALPWKHGTWLRLLHEDDEGGGGTGSLLWPYWPFFGTGPININYRNLIKLCLVFHYQREGYAWLG